MIASCYRRDEAHNPELFADALALVLGDYPAEIVQFAVDPRTGIIERFPMGLPNVGQIKQFLDDLTTRRARLQHYAALPKPAPFRRTLEKAEPNLFVPDDNRRYDAMAKKAAGEPDRARFANHVCHDGVTRSGVWVPLDWYESMSEKPSAPRVGDVGLSISQELAAQLGISHGHVEDHQSQ